MPSEIQSSHIRFHFRSNRATHLSRITKCRVFWKETHLNIDTLVDPKRLSQDLRHSIKIKAILHLEDAVCSNYRMLLCMRNSDTFTQFDAMNGRHSSCVTEPYRRWISAFSLINIILLFAVHCVLNTSYILLLSIGLLCRGVLLVSC